MFEFRLQLNLKLWRLSLKVAGYADNDRPTRFVSTSFLGMCRWRGAGLPRSEHEDLFVQETLRQMAREPAPTPRKWFGYPSGMKGVDDREEYCSNSSKCSRSNF